eukprot:1157074-Pelagomonas_calceolata.AAC.3
MAAQHRERQRADKGGPADQVTSLHQEQHPWHMARGKGKRANTQRDVSQKKIKESGSMEKSQQNTRRKDRTGKEREDRAGQNMRKGKGKGGKGKKGQNWNERKIYIGSGYTPYINKGKEDI